MIATMEVIIQNDYIFQKTFLQSVVKLCYAVVLLCFCQINWCLQRKHRKYLQIQSRTTKILLSDMISSLNKAIKCE